MKNKTRIKTTNIDTLLKINEKQAKIIEGYEAISGLYRATKTIPLIGKAMRMMAGALKGGGIKATVVVDNVLSKNPEIIGICNPHFRGVKFSTYTLTKDVFEVSEIYNRIEAHKIAKKIINHNPKKVLLSGYPFGYDLLAEELKKLRPEMRIFVLSHSAFLWFDVYPDENRVFNRILELQKLGVIEKIGFCKKDVAEYFRHEGYNSHFVMNRFDISKKSFKSLSRGIIKIGIFGSNWWHRNILNQVIAASMIPGVEIHVNEIGNHTFLDMSKIIVHGFLPKPEFDKLLSQMDINLYVSLTDCFPMTLIESMVNGIPAIASDTSDVYSYDTELKDSLVVSTIDGPIGIAKKIDEVITNYNSIQKTIHAYLPVLKKHVEESIDEFLL